MAKNPLTVVPFSDPPYLLGLPSPFYQEKHLAFQKACRAWMDEHFTPFHLEWENAGNLPTDLFGKFNKFNMLLPNLPSPLPVKELHAVGIKDILGTKVEDWDYVHSGIWIDEANRSGLAGPTSGLTAGFAYAIPPIIKYGSQALKDKFLPELLTGKKRACIAITEPDAGSDVANVGTTAEKSKDGKHYIVNGAKKWITNGIWSDYATMAVRTGKEPGAAGLSLLVVPLKAEGVEMRRMTQTGTKTGGTTFIELEDVKVPADNLIGEEGKGMFYIMNNFNHASIPGERLMIAIATARQARAALSAAMGYVMKREAFGKPVIEQPVVRHRLAKAGAELETFQSWLNEFLWQMNHLPKKDADARLGGLTALAKAKGGMVLNECAQVGVLLHGGNGFTETGQGELVAKIYRDVFATRIPGGSEDVMLDLAIRQLVKNFQKATKELEKSGGAKL